MRELRRRVGYGPEAFPDDVDTLIDPAFELEAVIPQLTIRPYASAEQKVKDDKQKDEDEEDVFYSGMEEEFVEIAWRQTGSLARHPHGLTAQVIPWGNLAQTAAASALPAVGGIFGEDRPWVRARLDNLVERNPGGGERKASLLMLQAKDG
jgi:hypothetical protein